MIKFGEFTEKQKEDFTKEIQKKPEKQYKEDEMMLWPEDDDQAVKKHFSKNKKQ